MGNVDNDPFLKIQSLKDLNRFMSSHASRDLMVSDLTPVGVTNILTLCEAFWMHSGDANDPHVELTSGLHSDGFVDVLKALTYANVCDLFAYHLVNAIEIKIHELDCEGMFDWVIGSDHAAANLSHDVAKWLGCRGDFTEKGPDKTQLWKRHQIEPDEVVLQVEELVTTLGTLNAVREGVRNAHKDHSVIFAPLVGTIVHRSSLYEFDGMPIVYLAHYDIETWEAKDCPLCKAGSRAIREPKKNWSALTGK